MRIRIPAELGGMAIVAIVGFVAAGVISGMLEVINTRLLYRSKTGKKIVAFLTGLVWLAAAVIVVLDLTGVAPLIRNLLFSL